MPNTRADILIFEAMKLVHPTKANQSVDLFTQHTINLWNLRSEDVVMAGIADGG